MASVFYPEIGAQFDADGFLLDMHQWNKALANNLARKDGLDHLTHAHWNIIHYLREHYQKNRSIPATRHVCHVYGLAPHCVDELFHNFREAWRIAGLPNPGEEAKSYM
jgi:tRNA 2-thiouridine synthesizing protein E